MYYQQPSTTYRHRLGGGSLSTIPIAGSGFRRRRRSGLGDAETATECPQPVSTAERDGLRDEIKGWTNPSEGTHFHEGHPDLIAAWNDVVARLAGLEARPKLLRCEKEARDRAYNWMGQLKDLQGQVKHAAKTGGMFTAVNQTFPFTVFRGPTYQIRSSSDPDVARAMQNFCVKVWGPEKCGYSAPGGAVVNPAPPSAPPGSVVIDGTVYPSSQAAAGSIRQVAPPVPSGPQTTTGTGPLSFPISLPSLEGQIFGIDTKLILLGVGGLVAYKFLFSKR